MLRKQLLTLLLVSLLSSSCSHGPKVTVCVSDPAAAGFDCYDERTGKSFFLPYAESDKYVAFNPTDAQTLLTFCAAGKK